MTTRMCSNVAVSPSDNGADMGLTIARAVAMTSLVAIAASGLWATAAQGQTDRRSLSGSEVAIYNVAGRMSIERGSGNDVVVEITKRGSDADKLSIEMTTVRGRPGLRVVYPDDDIIYDVPGGGRQNMVTSSWNDGDGYSGRRRQVRVRSSGRGTEAWADIRVLVPNGRSVDANLLAGEMIASDVDGNLTLDVASARVDVINVRGKLSVDVGSGSTTIRGATVSDLNIDSGSGNVTINDSRVSGVCKIDTGSGDVSGSSLSCAQLALDVGSGGVRFDGIGASSMRVESGSGNVRLGLSSVSRSVDIETGSGSVTLSVPSNLGGSVDLSAGSGSVSSDFPVQMTRLDRRHLRGSIGSGDARIRVETGSGSVHLRKS